MPGSGENNIPATVEDVIADIAAIFHWPASELLAMPLSDLIDWHGRAIARLPARE